MDISAKLDKLARLQSLARELQAEYPEGSNTYLALDSAVSATCIASHVVRGEPGLAYHNLENLLETAMRLNKSFKPLSHKVLVNVDAVKALERRVGLLSKGVTCGQ